MSIAFLLNEEAGPGPLTFPGFPGVWNQGEPVEASAFVELGAFGSVKEMQAAISDLGIPLTKVTVDEGSAPLPPRDNHVPNAEEAIAAAESALAEMTHAELDAKAASLGIEIPDDVKAAKVEAIEEHLRAVGVLEEEGAEALEEAES